MIQKQFFYVSRYEDNKDVVKETGEPHTIKVTFSSGFDGKVKIDQLNLGLGRTGNISMKRVAVDGESFPTMEVKSNLMLFNFPDGIEMSCNYFYQIGPRPGTTGTN